LFAFNRQVDKLIQAGRHSEALATAIKWRQVNLDRISKKKREALVAQLEAALFERSSNPSGWRLSAARNK
jgi:hypothetical protein